MEDIEQAAPDIAETSVPEASAAPESISDIFGEALKDKAGSPEETSQPEEVQPEGQVDEAEQPAVETPFGEITLDEARKVAFKNEKEFQAFLDRNPLLKEGFLRQSDYTRKTMQAAEERKKAAELQKQFEEKEAKESQAWGAVKPGPEDMSFFHNFWHVYQHGSDQLATQISAFAKDVSLIAQGKNPVGPLAGQNGQPVDYSRDSQVISVRREFDQYRQEQERKEQQLLAEKQEFERKEAVREVESWISEKQKSGIKLTQEELSTMARFSGLKDDDGKRISLDEMYRLALAKLGRTEKEAIKKVFTESKDATKRTPAKPASRVPASAKPEASNLDEIFSQGLEEIRS